jgi:DNA-binding PadR family transcriptional regulator
MASTAMQEPTLLLLTALADAPRHGSALTRLQQQGSVQATGEEVVEGRHRRYYALTAKGADALAEETARLQTMVREANRRLRLRDVTA